ncbi:MAG: transcription elongation factor GreB [Myxococcales bacterium]|nr:transcription elongation factor GreB [Myxococcales bacterium]
MDDKANYITPTGHRKILDEIDQLVRVERPKIVQEVSDAAAQGDRSENAEYIYGKKKLREIDRRLRFLQGRLAHIVVVDPSTPRGQIIFFGATVDVEDEDGECLTWQIVGVDEVDPARGKISWRSPIGRSLLRRKVGDTVSFQKPEGARVEYTVLDVRYE